MLTTDGAWKVDERGFNIIAENASSSYDAVRRLTAFATWTGGVDNVSIIAIEDLSLFAKSSEDLQRKNSASACVTLWFHESKFTISEPQKQFGQQSPEVKSIQKKSTKTRRKKQVSDNHSHGEADEVTQLDLITPGSKSVVKKVKVEISTEDNN